MLFRQCACGNTYPTIVEFLFLFGGKAKGPIRVSTDGTGFVQFTRECGACASTLTEEVSTDWLQKAFLAVREGDPHPPPCHREADAQPPPSPANIEERSEDERSYELPPGKTCGDCLHFKVCFMQTVPTTRDSRQCWWESPLFEEGQGASLHADGVPAEQAPRPGKRNTAQQCFSPIEWTQDKIREHEAMKAGSVPAHDRWPELEATKESARRQAEGLRVTTKPHVFDQEGDAPSLPEAKDRSMKAFLKRYWLPVLVFAFGLGNLVFVAVQWTVGKIEWHVVPREDLTEHERFVTLLNQHGRMEALLLLVLGVLLAVLIVVMAKNRKD